jgi:DNA replication protein DnaC
VSEEEKREALLAGQKVLVTARRDKRVVPGNGIGHRSHATWRTQEGRWTAPDRADLDRQPAAHRCPICGHVSPYVWDGLAGVWRATHGEPCEECARRRFVEAAMEESKAAMLHRYKLDTGRYAHMTLGSYRPDARYPSQAAAKRAAEAMIAAWTCGDWSAGILLASPEVGIGKTHLAIAAAREGVVRYRPAIGEQILAVWDMPSFVDAVRHTYDDGGTAGLMLSVQQPAILVLDDIGTEHVGKESWPWYQGLMFQIVNARWLSRRATIVTTNLEPDELWEWVGPRVFSRLVELTGVPLRMEGEDYRLRRASLEGVRA